MNSPLIGQLTDMIGGSKAPGVANMNGVFWITTGCAGCCIGVALCHNPVDAGNTAPLNEIK